MRRVTTWNVNGIRAALRKGMAEDLQRLKPDVLMLQEVRALPEQLSAEWRDPSGWNVTWHPAQKKGYSGVSTWTRAAHEVLVRGIDGGADDEGRVLTVQAGALRCVNVYLPSGSSGTEKQEKKERFMADFLPWAARMAADDVPTVIVGDLNIAHTENDIWNPTGNKKNSGFLSHERQWFTELLATGWTDVFREHFGMVKGPYSWWSNRGQARAKDRGWRIDYVLANALAARAMTSVSVDRQAGITTSDHAPVSVDFDL
ncbi:MAG: exodeoxyribonuclease-3 [Kiritimatiellia bacterium]|jgi:exodeoxyribonuclease-3